MNQNLPVQRANSSVLGSPGQADKAFSTSEMDPREILSTIFKHKSMIIASFFLITGLCCAAIIFYLKVVYQPVYEAKSIILVRPGWESQDIDLTPDRRETKVNNNPELVATEVRILQSRDLKEKVINELKPEAIFPDLGRNIPIGLSSAEGALYRFEKNFTVKSSTGNIVEASFKGPDPAIAAKVVSELINYYMDKRGDTYRNPKVFQFLDQKTEEDRQKLAEAESKLKTFQDQSQIISFDEQRNFLLNKQRQLVNSRHDTENEIAQLQEKTSALERQLPTIQKTSIDATVKMSDLENRLLGLELQEKELLSKYKEDNRLVVNVREQIQMTKNYIDTRGPGSKLAPVDPAYQDLQKRILENKADLSGLKIKQKDLEEQLKAVSAQATAFEAQESKYKQLSRDVTDKEEKYKTYLSKLEEARVHDELDRQKMTNVSVLEPPSVPIIPDNLPQPILVYVLVALLIGIAGSIGLAFVLEIMSPGMSTPAQVEKRLELPVLAVVAYK